MIYFGMFKLIFYQSLIQNQYVFSDAERITIIFERKNFFTVDIAEWCPQYMWGM